MLVQHHCLRAVLGVLQGVKFSYIEFELGNDKSLWDVSRHGFLGSQCFKLLDQIRSNPLAP